MHALFIHACMHVFVIRRSVEFGIPLGNWMIPHTADRKNMSTPQPVLMLPTSYYKQLQKLEKFTAICQGENNYVIEMV